jgi:hypothetical protein
VRIPVVPGYPGAILTSYTQSAASPLPEVNLNAFSDVDVDIMAGSVFEQYIARGDYSYRIELDRRTIKHASFDVTGASPVAPNVHSSFGFRLPFLPHRNETDFYLVVYKYYTGRAVVSFYFRLDYAPLDLPYSTEDRLIRDFSIFGCQPERVRGKIKGIFSSFFIQMFLLSFSYSGIV